MKWETLSNEQQLRKVIFDAFEQETRDWGLGYEKIVTEYGRVIYTDHATGSAMGMFELGWKAALDRLCG